MATKKIQILPLNRVEGDLRISLEYEGNTVTEAYSAGTMYRGFENIMKGRAPLDGLVITPRICGICSTSHLAAAAKALDMITQSTVPDNAIRVRNVTLMAEQLQNDVRHHAFAFMPDTNNSVYGDVNLYAEAAARYAPIKGESMIQTVNHSRKILEIVAILGGQWPHSSFMVPGGVVSVPGDNDLMQCRYVLRQFRKWYERQVLGCPCSVWRQIRSLDDLNAWMKESPYHRQSDMGFFLRFAKQMDWMHLGRGCGRFICYGSLDMPLQTRVKAHGGLSHLFPPGVYADGVIQPVAQEHIAEDISHSWFSGAERATHPYQADTVPYATGSEGQRYSWGKGPRYAGLPAETGPLAQMLMAQIPLFTDMISREGPSVLARQLARLARPALLIPAMDIWFDEIIHSNEAYFFPYKEIVNGMGHGLVEAPRGSLGHWVIIEEGAITRYQVISPTTWNASPRDAEGALGPWEQALVGTRVANMEAPVEVDHIIRSFDPCLVCTVHCADMTREV